MNKRPLFGFVSLAGAATVCAAGLMALSGCEERSYPAPSHSASPPAGPPADLMGGPNQAASPYTAPPVYAPPSAYGPPPAYAAPYDNGSVVAMEPIPNPGAPGSGPYYRDGRFGGRVHDHYDTNAPQMAQNTVTSPYGEGHPAPGRHPAYTTPTPVAPAYKAPANPQTAANMPAPKSATGGSTTNHKGVALAAAAAAGAAALQTKHDAVVTKPVTKTTVQTVQTKTATAAAPAPGPAGDHAASVATLQTALTDAVGKTAVLAAPAHFTANQPADVSLTLPAGFADTVHNEAQKDGLGDEAASVNVTALLSGAGFAVTPSDIQSAPLALGQPVEFRWTVTAQPNAKGPLHADIGADLLGGGADKLTLGSVQKAAGTGVNVGPHLVGVALLVLIGVLVVAWLARGRGGPTRSLAARRASRNAARGGRPLDMDAAPAEENTTP